jgi:hypothetical protein
MRPEVAMEKAKITQRSTFLIWAVLACLGPILWIAFAGCGGGGGGVETDVPFSGGEGTGADGVVTFWRHYDQYDTAAAGTNYSLDLDGSGGFYVAGLQWELYSNVPADYLILRADEKGIEQWRIRSGAAVPEVLLDIKRTADGGALAVGFRGHDDARDALAIKTDANGNILWEKVFAGGQSQSNTARAVCILPEGYAIAGDSGQSMWFFMIDQDGNMIAGSERLFPQAGWSLAHAMDKVEGGGFILAGVRNLGERPDTGFWLMRLNDSGERLWDKTYGMGTAHAVKSLGHYGFVAAGSTVLFPDNTSNAKVVGIDANGNLLWQQSFGGSYLDAFHGVDVANDGEIVAVGITRSYSGAGRTDLPDYAREDLFLVKLGRNGTPIWQKVKGRGPNNSEIARSVRFSPDGGFVVAGSGPNLLAKFDKNGDTINLGEKDFSYVVVGDAGLINLQNAVAVATAAGDMVFLPFEMGVFVVNLMTDALENAPLSDLCDGGGIYVWDVQPSSAIQPGSRFTVTFDNCTSKMDNGDSGFTVFNGSIGMYVEAFSGTLTGSTYDITLSIDPIAMALTDAEGRGTLMGAFNYTREHNNLDITERVQVANQKSLVFDGDDGRRAIRLLDISKSQKLGIGYSVGEQGEYGRVDPDAVAGTLTVTVEGPITGAWMEDPAQGRLTAVAQDGSNLAMSFDNGFVIIHLDTNGDGVVDATLRVKWADIN